jgi:hypothetical protein
MSFTRKNSSAVTPFCKVCYDAGLPAGEYTSHFVKDQPGPNGRVVCPTLLAQKCLICGVPGHTSSYCTESSSSSSSIVQKETRFKMADDDVRYPPHSIRLPPIQQQQQQQQYRPAPRIVPPPPRIVYADELQRKNPVAFPPLSNISSIRRFENDEPQLKRELPAAAEASPVHSPVAQRTRVKYNKKNNPFGVLLNNNVESDVDSDDETLPLPLPIIQKQEKSTSSSASSSSWASIAAGGSNSTKSVVATSKPELQRVRSRFSIVVPTAISSGGPLLPPISFKPKPVSASDLEKKQQVKKMWGDTDSEDDEEFLKRGIVIVDKQ